MKRLETEAVLGSHSGNLWVCCISYMYSVPQNNPHDSYFECHEVESLVMGPLHLPLQRADCHRLSYIKDLNIYPDPSVFWALETIPADTKVHCTSLIKPTSSN